MNPQRMCTVCREMKDKEGLLRIARLGERFLIDELNTAGGRGAYICKNNECLTSARRKNALQRSFSCGVPSEVYDYLEALTQNE